MKRFAAFPLIVILVITWVSGLAACDSKSSSQIITVERGDITEYVNVDSNLAMPHEVQLRFRTPGTVSQILVKKGERVKAGKLLAKLDDTSQKIALTAAQYDVELALNELAEKIYPSLLGYPHYYPSYTALLGVEQAQAELEDTVKYLQEQYYADAASSIRIIIHDLQRSRDSLQEAITYLGNNPDEAELYLNTINDPSGESYQQYYPAIPNAVEVLDSNLASLDSIQKMMENGSFETALSRVISFMDEMKQTRSAVKSACGRILTVGIAYPDASTSLSIMKQISENMNEIQAMLDEGSAGQGEIMEHLRIMQHDMETGQYILEDNELLLKNGINLKALRAYNLNFQKAELALKKCKEDLMDTELLAPFDGVVVDIGVKENDLLSAYDYSTKTAIHLVDTSRVELDGVVDEIDIFKVSEGQDAVVILDALPGEEIEGIVTFISPYSSEVAGVVNYPVTITLNNPGQGLKSGLTATARIVISSKPDVIVIPQTAVLSEEGGYYVQVVVNDAEMKLEKRRITVGEKSKQNIEVISGLEAGEKIISVINVK